jgi:ribosomal protein S30
VLLPDGLRSKRIAVRVDSEAPKLSDGEKKKMRKRRKNIDKQKKKAKRVSSNDSGETGSP